MYQKGNYYRNKRYYTNKGLTYQKKPQDPPRIIDQYYVPIYRNHFIKTKELMPYTPGISYIEFKKRSNVTETIGEFILDQVLAYNKNLTDVTKIEFEPELDVTLSAMIMYNKVTIFSDQSEISMYTPSPYGIWSSVTLSNYANITSTNNSKYTFTAIEGGWKIEMSPGVNEITTTGTISTSKNNINSSGDITDTQYDSSTTSPIQNEYKGYTRDVEDNILSLNFMSCAYTNDRIYSMIEVKVYF